MNKIINLLDSLILQEKLIKMILGSPRNKSVVYKKITIRPVEIKNHIAYQVEYHYEKKVVHENLNQLEMIEAVSTFIQNQFKQINIFATDADYQILSSNIDNPRILKQNPTQKLPDTFSHDHKKKYLIPNGVPCDFLIRLGVMGKDGQVYKKYYAKFRQINRFLEIVDDIIDRLSTKEEITIIDFGCGKAYLTFALYYYIHIKLKKKAIITGLDLKEDVIEFCNQVASDLHYDDLHFEMGDIAKYEGSLQADMVVTLHACDTATDYALWKAYHWNASVILSVPCCQHELFDQLKNTLHAPLLKHGILKERFCAILTDTMRTLKLEEWGYNVSMIEFTSLEHTSKNIMIRAVKEKAQNPNVTTDFEQLKDFWQVNPTIGQLG